MLVGVVFYIKLMLGTLFLEYFITYMMASWLDKAKSCDRCLLRVIDIEESAELWLA